MRRLLSKLTVLALSASPATSNASQLASAPSAIDDDDDADLDTDHIDRGSLDPHDAAHLLGRTLAHTLTELRPLDATHLATTWATADDPLRREAIARALAWVFPLFGDRAILAHLAHDPDSMIRAACDRATAVRRIGSVAPRGMV